MVLIQRRPTLASWVQGVVNKNLDIGSGFGQILEKANLEALVAIDR